MNNLRMNHVRRLAYLRRHIINFFPYLTLRKLANAALNICEQKLNVATPRSTPPYLKVEPTPLCQLACPGCAHGTIDLKKQLPNNSHMDLATFKKILDPFANNLMGVSLSLRGEPLLGKSLTDLIRYAHLKNVAVSFPTNLSMNLREKQIEELICSGLDALYVALDGASQETYGRYRVGGDFNLVVRNVRMLADAKKRFNKRRPIIIWKFIKFDHNRHEVERVRSMYKEMGFDGYELQFDGQSSTERSRKISYKMKMKNRKLACFWAWNTMVVRSDGEVMPCCQKIHSQFQVGNIFTTESEKIWNNDRFTALRRGFKTMSPVDLHPVCARCLGISASRENALR